MSQDAEIKGVIPNYYNLIIDKLNRIYEAWDQSNLTLALLRTLRLIPFLPRKLKNQLNSEKIRIRTRIKNSSGAGGYNYTEAELAMNNKIRNIAYEELEPLVDRLTSMLDESHLLTQSYGIPTKSRSMKDFQIEVDTARYGGQE